MDDLISRRAAIDAIRASTSKYTGFMEMEMYTDDDAVEAIEGLPSAQPEPHYCRECKWSWCYIKVDKHGNSETYWRCRNWDGETDKEGYCHEWERREE